MAAAAFFTIPGLVMLLLFLTTIDGIGSWMNRRFHLPWRKDGQRPISAIGLDEGMALFHSAKRHEMEQRRMSMFLKDDEQEGAAPRSEVDLEAGRAVIRKGHPGYSSDADR